MTFPRCLPAPTPHNITAVAVWLLLVAGGFTVGAWAATRLLHGWELRHG